MGADPSEGAFPEHIALLRVFLKDRGEIVERIEVLLNAQRRPADPATLARQFEDCFFARAATAAQTHLRGQLEQAHWAEGFRPRAGIHHVYNDLIHPAEMMMRAVHCWQQTRWPGRNGRIHYAQTLFHVYLLRLLQFLSMRIWDQDQGGAAGRLAEIQAVLDDLWKGSPAGQPAFVRDARWLIPLAQSLITDELAPYFEVARKVAETLPEADSLVIQKAQVRMLGGHLTSQIRYYCTKDGVSIDDPSVVLRTCTSNALDFAMLIQGLVALLQAYERALQTGDEQLRLDMAGAICQGISAEPELFLNRIDLLGTYSMIEHVFLRTGPEGQAAFSPLGERHMRLLKEYRALMGRLIQPLRDDAPRFRPVDGGCSPYGVIFGLPSNLIEHMALKAVQHDAETRFGLEHVFEDDPDDRDLRAAKLAWVNGWRDLPHVSREIQRLYEYPQAFAEEIYHRIERAFSRRDGWRTGRLYISSRDEAPDIEDLPSRYFVSSDQHMAAEHKAEHCDRAQLLAGRREAHFLVSYETPGGWVALKKELLTEVLGAGRDARIAGLPSGAAEVLRLMCTGLAMSGSKAGP
jgi:hypothetical protein